MSGMASTSIRWSRPPPLSPDGEWSPQEGRENPSARPYCHVGQAGDHSIRSQGWSSSPFRFTLFVDGQDVEETYVRTASVMRSMTIPVLVTCGPALERSGILGCSWCPLWVPECPRLRLSELRAYRWSPLYNVMRRDGDV